MIKLICLLVLCFACVAAACQKTDADFLVTISTEHGDMKLILYDSTPVHKNNFIELAQQKSYDGTIFHRVIDRFMIQGGDLGRKEGNTLDTEATLPAEIYKSYFHRKGALAAARQGDNVNPEKRSSAYQFYLVQGEPVEDTRSLTIDMAQARYHLGRFLQDSANVSISTTLDSLTQSGQQEEYFNYFYDLIPKVEQASNVQLTKEVSQERVKAYSSVGGTPHLDDQYTVFGQVVEGLDVIDKISAVEKNPDDSPKQPITMTVSVEEISREELRSRYGLDEQMQLP